MGHLLLGAGCERAERWLQIAATSPGSTAEDEVVFASCLAQDEPERARELIRAALAKGESIDPQWSAWARTLLEGGGL